MNLKGELNGSPFFISQPVGLAAQQSNCENKKGYENCGGDERLH